MRLLSASLFLNLWLAGGFLIRIHDFLVWVSVSRDDLEKGLITPPFKPPLSKPEVTANHFLFCVVVVVVVVVAVVVAVVVDVVIYSSNVHFLFRIQEILTGEKI